MTQDVPVAVECDVGRMRQTIVNFVGNAIKFTHRGKFGVKVGLDSHRDATPGQGKITTETGESAVNDESVGPDRCCVNPTVADIGTATTPDERA